MPIIDDLREKSTNFEDALSRATNKLSQRGGLESVGFEISLDDVADATRAGKEDELPGGGQETRMALEAIILEDLRPAYLIENDQIIIHGDYDRVDLIQNNKSMLEEVSKNIGRVDLLNHSTMEYVGTGWLIADDVVVTNRHVANVFSKSRWQGGWDFATDSFGRPLRVEVDFVRQNSQPADLQRTVKVTEVLFVAPQGGPDMAFLKVVSDNSVEPVELFTDAIVKDHPVATVGYPAWDGRRNDSDLMDSIFGGIYNVKRFSPGMINSTAEDGVIILGDYTSLGGNSGSAVLDLETGKAVGLHFAGVFGDTNYAVASDIVAAAFRAVSSPQISMNGSADITPTEAVDFSDRKGYDLNFLGTGEFSVPYPNLGDWKDDLAPVEGDDENILCYTHFSVLQSISRRLPMLTAVNIDGSKAFRLKRKGRWRLDGRLQKEHQIGNELYRHNPLDRGHMVRRMDPGWGDTREEAQQAEIDTFHYTNSAPQHKDLNQKHWLGLEDYILENASTKDFKVSVMTGPVYHDNDPRLSSQPGAEDVQIPQSFWKIAVMVNQDTGKLSATGYVLTQGEMIRDIAETAFVLGKYRTYQISIKRIEAATGFEWDKLRQFDPLNDRAESVFGESAIAVRGAESLVL